MPYKITSSLDWAAIETDLLNRTRGLMFHKDVAAMIRNIKPSITELSKEEVLLKRGRNQRAEALVEKINNDIEMVEEYILVAALIGKA